MTCLLAPAAYGAQFTNRSAGYSLTYPTAWNAEATFHGEAPLFEIFHQSRHPREGFVPREVQVRL